MFRIPRLHIPSDTRCRFVEILLSLSVAHFDDRMKNSGYLFIAWRIQLNIIRISSKKNNTLIYFMQKKPDYLTLRLRHIYLTITQRKN